jgi:hypothetical protein
MMPVRRKKVILCLASLLLGLPGVVFLVVPQAPLRFHAFFLARRLRSSDEMVRTRTREKLVALGRPAIDGVLPELVASLVEDTHGRVFVGEARDVTPERVCYDIAEVLPDEPQHPRRGPDPFTPGICLEFSNEENALRSRRPGHQLVVQFNSDFVGYAIDLDDPAVGGRVVDAVRARLLDPKVQAHRKELVWRGAR